MLCKTYCAINIGLTTVTVTVEIDISTGIGISIVGLPDSAVKESLTRVLTAIRSYGFSIPGSKIIINMAPADIKKEGTSFDLTIAVALLCAMKKVSPERMQNFMISGELALDGTVRPISGALPIAIHASEQGFEGCIFPFDSAKEAVDITGTTIYGVQTLHDVISVLSDDAQSSTFIMKRDEATPVRPSFLNDFKEVKGQKMAKRGLELAVAGGHNVLLIGSPGCGKSFMASCLPSIMPTMSREESIETSKIYSVAGESIAHYGLMKERPFRTPHNSASRIALLGGGQNALPGEISLAHNGVLYLDEIAQFSRNSLDLLRQPLEDGKITISRIRYKVEYPCSFMLVASMNPCPCGYYGDASGLCNCTPSMVENYLSRISGPMLDRIDMHIHVDRVAAEELTGDEYAEPSADIAKRVAAARAIQLERFAKDGIYTNAQMGAQQIRKYCQIGIAERDFLGKIIEKMHLSARAYSRILKLSRTIADLKGLKVISLQCISEAVQYRNLDRYNL